MKYTELKKLTKNLQRDCSKKILQEFLDLYNITGIKEVINPNIVILDSEKKDEFNIACSNNESFYLLHGEHNNFSYIRKNQIKEEPNINIDDNGYKEEYYTETNYTDYEDQIFGFVVREEQYIEDTELIKRLPHASMALRKTMISKYVLPQELLDEKLPNLSIHMNEYNNLSDPILRRWYIENFVDYFTNNDLDLKLRSIKKDQAKVLKK